MTDLEVTFNTVSLPTGTSGTITVYEDQTGDGTSDYSDSATLSDGVTEYTLTGFDGSSGNDIWPEVSLDNTDVTFTAETAEPVSVSAPSGLPITIDGTKVTEITIDGTVVTGLTIDGTTVF